MTGAFGRNFNRTNGKLLGTHQSPKVNGVALRKPFSIRFGVQSLMQSKVMLFNVTVVT